MPAVKEPWTEWQLTEGYGNCKSCYRCGHLHRFCSYCWKDSNLTIAKYKNVEGESNKQVVQNYNPSFIRYVTDHNRIWRLVKLAEFMEVNIDDDEISRSELPDTDYKLVRLKEKPVWKPPVTNRQYKPVTNNLIEYSCIIKKISTTEILCMEK